ncbi:MAG: TraB/GumN family protein [Chitinophagaceae bacterium]|nr:TraB/GumN family protein [Chitinophagaceae bacterium]
MKVLLRLFFLTNFVLFGYGSIAQSNKIEDKTLLWQITGKNIKEPSYLFGTIHIMCPGDIQITDVLKEKFSATRQLFLELKMDDPSMMIEMMKGMKMKDSSTIKSLLGPSSYDSANVLFKKSTGIQLDLFNSIKPILVVSMIYPFLLGCTPDSWENNFQKMAKAQNKPLLGLEKISEQMNVLESIPYKEQADMLAKTLFQIDSTKNIFLNMLEVYKQKDLVQLYTLTTSDRDFGMYERDLLINRNRNWITVITGQVEKIPTFFAFGAAHLGGQEGVINLLRKEGYTIKPVLY